MQEIYINIIYKYPLIYWKHYWDLKKTPKPFSIIFTLVTHREHDMLPQQKHNSKKYNEKQTGKTQTLSEFWWPEGYCQELFLKRGIKKGVYTANIFEPLSKIPPKNVQHFTWSVKSQCPEIGMNIKEKK